MVVYILLIYLFLDSECPEDVVSVGSFSDRLHSDHSVVGRFVNVRPILVALWLNRNKEYKRLQRAVDLNTLKWIYSMLHNYGYTKRLPRVVALNTLKWVYTTSYKGWDSRGFYSRKLACSILLVN